VLGQVGRVGLAGDPVGEGGDGLAGDREVFKVGLGLPQPSLQFVYLGAEVVGHGQGGVFLDAERVEQGLDVYAGTVRGSRHVGAFVPVRRRAMTWVIAQ
jgi:hypothetical protein